MSAESKMNNFESKVSYKIETNSKGFNTSIHVYQGATQEEIKQTILDTIWGHKFGQEELLKEVTKSG